MTTDQRTIEISYERPWLYPKQLEAFFCKERFAVIEASTKSGKTVGCIAWLNEQAWTNGGEGARHFWWVAPVSQQARIAYRRWLRGLSVDGQTTDHNDSRMEITLLNGSIIEFKSADNPDSLYGEDVYAAVIDEASRCREEAWHAVRSTLTFTQGPVRIIGNVRGRKNWAYRLGEMARAGEPDLAYFKLTATDAVHAGVLQLSEVDSARRLLPEDTWRELYMAEAADDAGNPFGHEHIKACTGELSMARPRVWGWDLAQHQDWTVGIALDESWKVCRFQRWQKVPWPDTQERILQETALTPALMDQHGVGDPVVQMLQRDGRGRYEGFKFSTEHKQELMQHLALVIQGHRVTFPPGPIVAELEAFEYTITREHVLYSAPQGMHDDCVMALALACWHAKEKRVRVGTRKAVKAPRSW